MGIETADFCTLTAVAKIFHLLRYGHIEMEILLEMDCGLDVDFEPDWVSTENHSEQSKVRWQLSNGTDKDSLDGLLSELEAEESLYRSSSIMEGVRLLYRHDKGIINP